MTESNRRSVSIDIQDEGQADVRQRDRDLGCSKFLRPPDVLLISSTFGTPVSPAARPYIVIARGETVNLVVIDLSQRIDTNSVPQFMIYPQ